MGLGGGDGVGAGLGVWGSGWGDRCGGAMRTSSQIFSRDDADRDEWIATSPLEHVRSLVRRVSDGTSDQGTCRSGLFERADQEGII